MRYHLRFVLFVIVFMVIVSASRAGAVPIGEFAWQSDEFFGETFSVANFSSDFLPVGESFLDVFIDLVFSDGTSTELGFGDVVPGDTVQSTTSLADFDRDILAASLRLSFPLGQVTTESLTGIGVVAINFPQDSSGPNRVPEPSSLVMIALGSALALLGGWRRRAARG